MASYREVPDDANVMDDAENIVDVERTARDATEYVGDDGVTDDPGVETPEEDVPFEQQVDVDDGSGI